MPGEPKSDGKIVELVNLPSRFEADAVIAMLRTNGIQAMGNYGDADGWMPNMGLLDGFRVSVFDDDLDAARRLLDANETAGE